MFPNLESFFNELIVQRKKLLLSSKSQKLSHCCSSIVTVASEVAMLWRKLVSGPFPEPNSYQLLNDFFYIWRELFLVIMSGVSIASFTGYTFLIFPDLFK